MIDHYFLSILIVGSCLAITTGLLGNFIVWRRMAYFGDSLAHSALLGIVLGMILQIETNIAIILVAFLFTLLILFFQQKQLLAVDTILGILAHAALAIGLVTLHFLNRANFDLHSVLFGNILTITSNDIFLLLFVLLLTSVILYFQYSKFLLMSISEELARAEGVKVTQNKLLLMLLLSLVIAVSIQMIGILLITSLLIMPAATSRMVSNSPKSMTFFSVVFALMAVIIGIFAAFYFDMVVGPFTVLVSFVIFACTALINFIRNK